MARVRRNVWKLEAEDQTLFWYGRAIEAMQSRPISDPTSWRFQAAIHNYPPPGDPDPNPELSRDIQDRFWKCCQHSTWFFLPWHRMYLYFFERTVAAAVESLGGPKDWALPYWNYSADLESRLLPPAFRNPTLPDGSKNYLFVEARAQKANAGEQFADDADVDLRPALTQTVFTTNSGLIDFGGPKTAFAHFGPRPGQLENGPHNHMHNAVGGWMARTTTAGLDPIFWLHHANIDRLWQVWLNLPVNPPNHNPPDELWLKTISFDFHDADGKEVSCYSKDVEDTTVLDYTYDDTSDPLGVAAPAAMLGSPAGSTEDAMSDDIPPEVVGISETNIQVGNTHTRIHVAAPAHAAATARRAALTATADDAAAAVPRLFLQLENLTAPDVANSYDVYVNIPEGEDPTQHPQRFAGRVSPFGIERASRASDQHPGSGLTFALDISDVYQQLSTAGDWDPNDIQVSLVPAREWEGEPVTVGRVSLHVG